MTDSRAGAGRSGIEYMASRIEMLTAQVVRLEQQTADAEKELAAKVDFIEGVVEELDSVRERGGNAMIRLERLETAVNAFTTSSQYDGTKAEQRALTLAMTAPDDNSENPGGVREEEPTPCGACEDHQRLHRLVCDFLNTMADDSRKELRRSVCVDLDRLADAAGWKS